MTTEAIKTMESIAMVQAHSLEITMRTIETAFVRIYQESKDYKKLVKLYGKTNADRITAHYTHRVLSQDDTYHLGQCLDLLKKLHFHMEHMTFMAIAMDEKTEDKGRKEMEMFDALMNDARHLSYYTALMFNIPEQDAIKLESQLKLLAKDHTVPNEVLDILKP